MKRPYYLVPDEISDDTVDALQELLRDARAGRLIGFAFAGMYRERKYVVNTTGEATRSPTFTRGMVSALDDFLAAQVAKTR